MVYPIGIDLGTTNSVACVWRKGQVETIPVEGRQALPSAISIRPDGNVLVGFAAKQRAMMNPEESVTSAKRVIGDGKTQWEILGKTYTPVDVSAMLLGRLREIAGAHLGGDVRDAVITVPAYFNNHQKRDTKAAGEAAGFNVLQLLPEPTAAAISYGLDKGKDQVIMVYDLGGGTFDVSILEVKGNRFQAVAVDGDFQLGGDDFDLLLVDHLIGLLEKRTKKDMGILRSLLRRRKKGERKGEATQEMLLARQKLKEIAEETKKELSESDTATVIVSDILGTSLEEEIELGTYNGLIRPFVERTVEKMKAVLKAAKMSKDDIDRVILVGGSTRNRLVKERVTETIKEPWTSDRVDEVVSQGAAIVAGYLSSPEEDLRPIEAFSNVTPFALGVCALEGEGQSNHVNSIIIPKNSPVPCVESRPYELQTVAGGDNRLEVYMLQGEDKDPTRCLMIGKYVFSDVSHGEDNKARIDIEYGYDRDGIITVKASESTTGRTLPFSIEAVLEGTSWLDALRKSKGFDVSSLNLLVTPAGYDDIGNILTYLGLPFRTYSSSVKTLDCDIFFWNCLASKYPSSSVISNYVANGGCLYASCCAAKHLVNAFPGAIDFKSAGCKTKTIQATVVDEELLSALGRDLHIHYNSAACYSVSYFCPESRVLLRESETDRIVMVMAPFGQGHIFYTCFHHHDNMSEQEKSLLKLLVMKQISVVSGIPIEIVSDSIKNP